MDTTIHEKSMFCTTCGTPTEPGARFCGKCGSRVPEQEPQASRLEQSPRFESPGAWSYPFPPFKQESVRYESRDDIEVEWNLNYNLLRYERPVLPPFPVKVLVTTHRVVLLDRNNNLVRKEVKLTPLREITYSDTPRRLRTPPLRRFPMASGPIPLSPFWVLKRAANEELYREFMSNPKDFSKVRGAWWVEGYRAWSRVKQVTPLGAGDLQITLEGVRAFSQMGPGRQRPITNDEGTAVLRLGRERDAVKSEIEGFLESGDAFSQEFRASIPRKPESPAFKAYTNVFWIAAAEVIPVGVLWGMDAPRWVILLVGLGVAWFTLRLLDRFRSRAQDPTANPPNLH